MFVSYSKAVFEIETKNRLVMKKLKIVITDSGLGGLDIAGRIYEKVTSMSFNLPIEIIFVNALPEVGKGYNTMKNKAEKVSVFGKVLNGIEKNFSPAVIGIACNTLSAIVEETDYYKKFPEKIINIIDLGVEKFLTESKHRENKVVVFGTQTTIQSGEYERKLFVAGIKKDKILSIPCPGLAEAIEYDYTSSNTEEKVKACVENILAFGKTGNVTVFLACTHYPYVKNLFEKYLTRNKIENYSFLIPNDVMVEKTVDFILQKSVGSEAKKESVKTEIKVFSRALILPEEIESIAGLLKPVSSETAKALRNYVLNKALF